MEPLWTGEYLERIETAAISGEAVNVGGHDREENYIDWAMDCGWSHAPGRSCLWWRIDSSIA